MYDAKIQVQREVALREVAHHSSEVGSRKELVSTSPERLSCRRLQVHLAQDPVSKHGDKWCQRKRGRAECIWSCFPVWRCDFHVQTSASWKVRNTLYRTGERRRIFSPQAKLENPMLWGAWRSRQHSWLSIFLNMETVTYLTAQAFFSCVLQQHLPQEVTAADLYGTNFRQLRFVLSVC